MIHRLRQRVADLATITLWILCSIARKDQP
jgi:hypothetical protein